MKEWGRNTIYRTRYPRTRGIRKRKRPIDANATSNDSGRALTPGSRSKTRSLATPWCARLSSCLRAIFFKRWRRKWSSLACTLRTTRRRSPRVCRCPLMSWTEQSLQRRYATGTFSIGSGAKDDLWCLTLDRSGPRRLVTPAMSGLSKNASAPPDVIPS